MSSRPWAVPLPQYHERTVQDIHPGPFVFPVRSRDIIENRFTVGTGKSAMDWGAVTARYSSSC